MTSKPSVKIFQYSIPLPPSHFIIEMPQGARLLDVQMQSGEPALWAIIDPDLRRVRRMFVLLGMGHDAGDVAFAKYVGTIQMQGRAFHLFDLGEAT